jgi:aminoglycoside 6'-N-acetyltransferase
VGSSIALRPAGRRDIDDLVPIRRTPEVFRWWRGGDDHHQSIEQDLEEEGSTPYVVELDGIVVGWIQWSSEDEPDYRYASIDLYLEPAVHGRGIGADAVRTLARHLISEHHFHRLEIDPAADNERAIRCYRKVGFHPVGIRRQSERGADGSWHDALLMDLLAPELTDEDRSPTTSPGRPVTVGVLPPRGAGR